MRQLLYQNDLFMAARAVICRGSAWLGFLGLALLTPLAWAADGDALKAASPIAINLKQFKVIQTEQGEQKLIDAALVVPGDVIEYRATYVNRASVALPVVATLPVPESMEYIKESAKANGNLAHTVALKDSRYSAEPLLQKVTTAGGQIQTQPAPYAAYRFVRWDLGRLPAESSVDVSIRAKVSQDPERDGASARKAPAQVSSTASH